MGNIVNHRPPSLQTGFSLKLSNKIKIGNNSSKIKQGIKHMASITFENRIEITGIFFVFN